jgi:hypothetical protein
MKHNWTKDGYSGRGVVLGIALALGVLSGCAENSGGGGNYKTSGAQAPAAADASPATVRARIAKICLGDPERFFGGANNPARCDCYGAGVARTLNKDELSYVVTYNEIPSLSANEYDNIKQRCLAGGATADEKPSPKKKSPKEKS